MWCTCSNIIYILFLIYVIPIDEERPSSAHSQISVKEAAAVVDNTEKVRYWLALINNNVYEIIRCEGTSVKRDECTKCILNNTFC